MLDTNDVFQPVIIRFPSHYFRASWSLNMLLSETGYDARVSSWHSHKASDCPLFLAYTALALFHYLYIPLSWPRCTVGLHHLYPYVSPFQWNHKPKLRAMRQLMFSHSTLLDIQVFRDVTPCRLFNRHRRFANTLPPLLDPEDERTRIYPNVGNYALVDTA
jgi:hypothetical protein